MILCRFLLKKELSLLGQLLLFFIPDYFVIKLKISVFCLVNIFCLLKDDIRTLLGKWYLLFP